MPRFILKKNWVLLVVLMALASFWLQTGVWNAAAQTETPGNPDMPASEAVSLGAELYAENCQVCHGIEGQGRVGATLAKDWPSIRPDLTIRAIIARGVPGSPMPAWSAALGGPLSDAEIDALVAYILSWQTGGAPQITPRATATLIPPITPIPDVAGDPNHGAVLFSENCDMCHGPDGQGRTGATLAKEWGGVRPDLSVRTTIANGIAGSAMPAWSQTNGGPLSETDIDDLTAFVLTLADAGQVVQISPTASASDVVPGTVASEWTGVILFIVLFIGIIIIAMLIQRPSNKNSPPG